MRSVQAAIANSVLLQTARAWYEQRPINEQRALQSGAVVSLAVLMVLFIWMPVTEWSEKHHRDYVYQEKLSGWLADNLAKASELKKAQAPASTQRSLSSLIGSTANQNHVTVSKVQPDRKGAAVWVEDAAYQNVLKWLISLESKHRVKVQQIQLDRLQEAGRVKAYVHFSG